MAKGKIADKYLHRTRFFATTTRPGRFSPKSALIFIKAGPKFSKLTPQQQKVKVAGIKCGAEIRGKYKGSGQVSQRREAMGKCIRKEFGYSA
jgi:hypothetical protein